MSDSSFPRYVPLQRITKRLPQIFPDGLSQHRYLIREMSAKTIFVMFYIGAVEESDQWLRPNQVTRMTDAQAKQKTKAARKRWSSESLQPNTENIPGRWYADNTREPIRDETLRFGLVEVGAVFEREGLATTSPQPRYALRKTFARVFTVSRQQFPSEARKWQEQNLTRGALARLALVRQGVAGKASKDEIAVKCPNGAVRRIAEAGFVTESSQEGSDEDSLESVGGVVRIARRSDCCPGQLCLGGSGIR